MSYILFATELPLANYQCYTKEALDVFHLFAYVTFIHYFHSVMSKGKNGRTR